MARWTPAEDAAIRAAAARRAGFGGLVGELPGRGYDAIRKRASRIGAFAAAPRAGGRAALAAGAWAPGYGTGGLAGALAALTGAPTAEVFLLLCRGRAKSGAGADIEAPILRRYGLRPEPNRAGPGRFEADSWGAWVDSLSRSDSGRRWLVCTARGWVAVAGGWVLLGASGRVGELRGVDIPGPVLCSRRVGGQASEARAVAGELPGPEAPRALDLYCGGGGVARGLQAAGWHVTGIDREARHEAAYPGRFVAADIGEWMTASRDIWRGVGLVWASPPCQRFSIATPAGVRDRHPDLIPLTRRILAAARAAGAKTVLENVPGAPIRADLILSGADVGLRRIRRRRVFELGGFFVLNPGVPGRAGEAPGPVISVVRRGATRGRAAVEAREAREAMGFEADVGLTAAQLGEAIPPAMAELIGRAARAARYKREGHE